MTMYQKPNTKRTATIGKDFTVTFMCDDGWEEILDCRMSASSNEEALQILAANGFVEFDPNAALKAKGFVFINGTYQMPGGV